MRYLSNEGCHTRQGQKAIAAFQDQTGIKALTVTIVGKSSCNNFILHLGCTVHLRSPILARPTLVFQGLVDGTWKYVMIMLQRVDRIALTVDSHRLC